MSGEFCERDEQSKVYIFRLHDAAVSGADPGLFQKAVPESPTPEDPLRTDTLCTTMRTDHKKGVLFVFLDNKCKSNLGGS